jgi:hypothetical protein
MDQYFFNQVTFESLHVPQEITQSVELQYALSLSQASYVQKAKTRGRKKLRPGNPLKTEVLDKFWLRAFKNFTKLHLKSISQFSKEREFWTWYSSRGKPGRKSNFLSYNSSFKEKLFKSKSFCSFFSAWGLVFGCFVSQKKVLKASWEFYFEYLLKELVPKAYQNVDMEELTSANRFVCEKFVSLAQSFNQEEKPDEEINLV